MLSYGHAYAQRPGRFALVDSANQILAKRPRAYWPLFAVGLLLLAALIVKIGPTRMLAAWARADHLRVLAAVLVFTCAVFIRGFKWRVFLGVTPHPLRYIDALRAYVLNAFLANLTPGRAGELFAPVWLGRHGVPTATGYAVVVVDRTLDVIIVLLLFAAAVWNLGQQAPLAAANYQTAGMLFTVLLLAALAVLLFSLWRLDLAVSFLARFRNRLAVRLRTALESFRQALTHFRHRRVLAANFGLTLLTWIMDITTGYLLVGAFIPHLTWIDSGTAAMFATAAALVSFIPGGIGVGAVGYTAVIALLGYDADLAGAGAILMTCVVHLIRASLAGLLAYGGKK